MRSDKGETKGGEDASNGEEKDGEENGPSGTLEPEVTETGARPRSYAARCSFSKRKLEQYTV